jgi:hypothetical protein
VTIGLKPKRVACALAVAAFGVASFVFGFSAGRQLKRSTDAVLRQQYLAPAGDAPHTVRLQVLKSLRAFQEGYVKRNPDELESFMSRLFAEDHDVLLMGTDANEWCRGHRSISEFIKEDWRKWGDFRFDVDNSLVWTFGDVAWTASVGTVHSSHADRPVRFATILARKGDGWVFRQLHFQWDERQLSTSELLDWDTQVQLVKLFYGRLWRRSFTQQAYP